MIEIASSSLTGALKPKISVIGIGGSGNNSVDRMIASGLENVDFISVNTDYQVLCDSQASQRIQIGKKLTSGLGAGSDPSIGESSAEEDSEEISSAVADSKMVILTCGLGGGTGTGAIPVIARICRDLKILTVAVVTLPFSFEGAPRMELAQKGLNSLRDNVDMLLVIPNDKLLEMTEKNFYLDDAFLVADEALKNTIEGVTGIIFGTGTINVDFNDIKATFENKGLGHLGIGSVKKDEPIIDAVKQAINSPLLDTDISSASNILMNTSGRINLKELNEAMAYIHQITDPSVKIIWGTVSNKAQDDEIVVTVIATGLSAGNKTYENDKSNPKLSFLYNSGAPDHSMSINSSSRGISEPVRKPGANIPLQIPEFLQHYSKLRKGN
ncbi:MAG: cell division protein FtsZ [Lachnospiraceae bacterium]|nr:cell division protein FtsZ [Lachnospiraceae bacterium]